MKNVRTTVAGVLTIAGALLGLVGKWVATKTPPSAEEFAIVSVALTTGAGLIAARDADKSEPK